MPNYEVSTCVNSPFANHAAYHQQQCARSIDVKTTSGSVDDRKYMSH